MYMKDIWGEVFKSGDNEMTFDGIPACYRNIQYYAQNIDARVGNTKLPMLLESISEFVFTNGRNNPSISWAYRPQICVLKSQELYPHFRNKYSQGSTTFIYGSKVNFAYDGTLQIGTDSQTQRINDYCNFQNKV